MSKIKTRLLGLCAAFAVLAVGTFAAGCGSGDEGEASGGGGGDEFTIGVVASQTGWLAQFEETFLNGLKLAVKEANADGGIDGKRVNLVMKDGKSDPAEGAIAAQEIIADDPSFLVVPCDQDMALPAARLGQDNGIPTMSSCAAASTFPQIIGDFMFLNTPGTYAEGSALAQFALDQGWKTSYVLTTKDAAVFSTSSESFAAQFEKGGGQVTGNGSYSMGQPKYTSQTSEIANLDPQPDVIMLSTNTPETTIIIKELASQGVETPIVTIFGNHTDLMGQAGNTLQQIPTYVTTIGVVEPGTTIGKFYDRYEKEYGQMPDTTFAALGADVVDLIEAAVKDSGSTDPQAIRDSINETEDVELTSGTVTYKGQAGVPRKGFFVLRALPDGFEVEEQFFPEDVFEGASN